MSWGWQNVEGACRIDLGLDEGWLRVGFGHNWFEIR